MTPSQDGPAILHVTDTHLFPDMSETLIGMTTYDSFCRVLECALREREPDAIIASGDISQVGEAEAYEHFIETVRQSFSGPLLCVPGNHDLSAAFAMLDTGNVTLGDWTLVGVDTHVDGEVPGHVCDDVLAALRDTLQKTRNHVLVAGHHPPFDIGTSWLDTQRIDNGSKLVDLLASFEAVRGYVFGHVHQAVERPIGNVSYLGTPSTCFQFEPGSSSFAIDQKPPGWRWLRLQDDGSIDSKVGRLEGYALKVDLTDKKY